MPASIGSSFNVVLPDSPFPDRPDSRGIHRARDRHRSDRIFEKRSDALPRRRFEDLLVSEWAATGLPAVPPELSQTVSTTAIAASGTATTPGSTPSVVRPGNLSETFTAAIELPRTPEVTAGAVRQGDAGPAELLPGAAVIFEAGVAPGDSDVASDEVTGEFAATDPDDLTQDILQAIENAEVIDGDGQATDVDAKAAESAEGRDAGFGKELGEASGPTVSRRNTGGDWHEVVTAAEGDTHRQMGGSDTRPAAADNGAEAAVGPRATSDFLQTTPAMGAAQASFAELASADVRPPLSTQVARAVSEYVRNEPPESDSQLRLRLDPPDLGELTISLRRSEHGLAIRVEAVERTTLDMLLARGDEIQRQLQQQHERFQGIEFGAWSSGSQGDSSSGHQGTWHRATAAAIRGTGSIARGMRSTTGRTPQVSAASDQLSFRA